MDFKQIQELIKLVNKTDISEVKIADKDFQITIRTKDFVGNITKRHEPAQQITLATQPQQVPVATHPSQDANTQAAAENQTATNKTGQAASNENNGEQELDTDKYDVFKSPMIGTFYRRPGPDKDAFVGINDKVKTGDVLCVIEAMKLFNEIEFEGEGTIVKILVEDSTPVEYDQPLFLIEPA